MLLQIGWATINCPFTAEEGVGDAPDSYAYGEGVQQGDMAGCGGVDGVEMAQGQDCKVWVMLLIARSMVGRVEGDSRVCVGADRVVWRKVCRQLITTL